MAWNVLGPLAMYAGGSPGSSSAEGTATVTNMLGPLVGGSP